MADESLDQIRSWARRIGWEIGAASGMSGS